MHFKTCSDLLNLLRKTQLDREVSNSLHFTNVKQIVHFTAFYAVRLIGTLIG